MNPENSIPHTGDVDTLHAGIVFHPRFGDLQEETLSRMFRALRFADLVHLHDRRKDGTPYITHPIRLVEQAIEQHPQKNITNDVIILALHDVIEDHGEEILSGHTLPVWREVLDEFGWQIFRDVLILSKIPMSMRRSILEYITRNADLDDPLIAETLRIISPIDPIDKFKRLSLYSENTKEQDAQRFRAALEFYRERIISREDNEKKANDEYISLGNYLYFSRADAQRKLRDMIDNIRDIPEMPEGKRSLYAEKRRIKAYILGVKLRNFGMGNAYSELETAFQKVELMMYTDSEILPMFGRDTDHGSLPEH